MADERRAPQKFAAVCGNVGPAESTGRGKVCFRFNWGRDRSLLGSTPAAVRGGGGRIAFSAPPQIYPEVDTSSRNFLSGLASIMNPAEVNFVVNPPGYITAGTLHNNNTGGFRRTRDSRLSVANRSYRVRGVDERDGSDSGPVNKVLRAASVVATGSLKRPFASASLLSSVGQTAITARRLSTGNSLATANEARKLELEERRKGIIDQQLHGTYRKTYSDLIEYGRPLDGPSWEKWNRVWLHAKGTTYLEKNRERGLTLMHFNKWSCVFSTWPDKKSFDSRNATVVLDIITVPTATGNRHATKTIRGTVNWLFKQGVQQCLAETAHAGGGLWWRQNGVVAVVDRLRKSYGTFCLLPIPGHDYSDNPDTDDEELELFATDMLAPDETLVDDQYWCNDDSNHPLPPLVERLMHVRAIGGVLKSDDDQYAVNILGHALKHAESITGLRACTDTTEDAEAAVSRHMKTLAVVTANAILSGHESRAGYNRRIKQLNELDSLHVTINGVKMRVHPKDTDVAKAMDTLLRMPIMRSIRTLRTPDGRRGADLSLAAALKFADEGIGHLVHPPESTRHVVLRFEKAYWSALRNPNFDMPASGDRFYSSEPGGTQQTLPLMRDDAWHDAYALAGIPSPVDAYMESQSSGGLCRTLAGLLSIDCMLHAEIMGENEGLVEVFVYTESDSVEKVVNAVASLAKAESDANDSEGHVCTSATVPLLRVQFMADAGARSDRSLIGGQTIKIFKLVDAVGLSESLTYNAYPVLAYSGGDDGESMRLFYYNIEREKRQLRHRPLQFAGTTFGFDDGEGGDGKGRRDQMGGRSSAGCGKRGWRNENCTVCTSTLSSNLHPDLVCQPCRVQDRTVDGEVQLGMESCSVLRFYFGELQQVATMLKKEADMQRIIGYFQTAVDESDEHALVHVGKSFRAVDNDLRQPLYSPVKKAAAIIRWLNQKSDGTISKVKKHLRQLHASTTVFSDFAQAAEQKILGLEQLLRTEGKTKKKDVLPGLVPLLTRLVDSLCLVEEKIAVARRKIGDTEWDAAVRSFLTPSDGSQLGVRDISPVESLQAIGNIRAETRLLLLRIKRLQARSGVTQPVLPADVHADMQRLLHGKHGLFALAGGAKGGTASVIDHIRDASLGLKDICLYDRMPILGILHLFTIRGWGTLFSAIGMLAWVSGCARRLTIALQKRGMNVHYYKTQFNSSTLQFGGVKAKGYDSVRIMTEPEKYFGALLPADRIKVCDIVSLWYGIWLTVGCSLLGHPECQLYRQQQRDSKKTIKSRASKEVASMCSLLAQLLHGTFGPAVWTPSVHSVCYDVPRAFKEGDLFGGREDSIEGCQSLARGILARCLGSEERNAECLRRWLALLAARRQVIPALVFIMTSLKRQLASWNTKRCASVDKAMGVVAKYQELNGGFKITGPPPQPEEPGGGETLPGCVWTPEAFQYVFGTPSLTDRLRKHDTTLFGEVAVSLDGGNTRAGVEAMATAATSAAAPVAPTSRKNTGRTKSKGKRRKGKGRARSHKALATPTMPDAVLATCAQVLASGVDTLQVQEPPRKRSRTAIATTNKTADTVGATQPADTVTIDTPAADGDVSAAGATAGATTNKTADATAAGASTTANTVGNPKRTYADATADDSARLSREAAEQAWHDMDVEPTPDDDLLPSKMYEDELAAGHAELVGTLLQSHNDVESYDDVETGEESDDADEDLQPIHFALGKNLVDVYRDAPTVLCFRQTKHTPPDQSSSVKPSYPLRDWQAGDTVEFAVNVRFDIWQHYVGTVASVLPGGQTLAIVANDGSGTSTVEASCCKVLKRARVGNREARLELRAEVGMYRADLGGLCTVRKGQVGWGLRHTKGDGFVVVCPLRPLDAPQERWAKVGGEDSGLLHVVDNADVLFGFDYDAEEYHQRMSDNARNVARIRLDDQLRAEHLLACHPKERGHQ
jgi:hypothetical protein